VSACYGAGCVVEHVFADDDGVYTGLEVVLEKWAADLREYSGELPGGRRFEVGRVAGIETGWGWVRAEWLEGRRRGADGPVEHLAGHSDFWIEDGTIRRHRSVSRPVGDLGGSSPPASSRHYPSRPIVGIGAVIVTDAARIVLVKRRHEPLARQWSLPGGMLELGETLEAGTAREILEETGLVVDVGPVVEVFDRILVDDEAQVRYHFVLVDHLCRPLSGELAAGSDVSDVALADPADLASFRVNEKVGTVVARAVEMNRGHPW